jgi:hypothetical protein
MKQLIRFLLVPCVAGSASARDEETLLSGPEALPFRVTDPGKDILR